MKAHVMVARQNMYLGLLARWKQGVKSEQNSLLTMRIILAPFDIVVKLCWRAPKALVKKVAKEEYVLWTEIGLRRLISPKNSVLGRRVEDPLFPLTYASATLCVVCQTSGLSLTPASVCLLKPLPSWRLMMREQRGKSTARAPGSRQRTRSRRGCQGGKGRLYPPTSSCAGPSLMSVTG